MKFKIRFADQIVGVLILAALLALIFVIFMLGSKQRWFAKDQLYTSLFDSANGLSKNMDVQYKGFTVGKVRSFELTDSDQVKVEFYIYEDYLSRVKEGSLVEVVSGLGSQFLFHPGRGTRRLDEGSLVPNIDSPQGQAYVQAGMAHIISGSDSISNLIARANILLDPRQDGGLFSLIAQANAVLADADRLLVQIGDAAQGTDETVLGRTLLDVEKTMSGVAVNLETSLNSILADVQKILGELSADGGLVYKILDGDGSVYTSLEASLYAVSGILLDLEKVTTLLPAQVPQIVGLITELRGTLQVAEDVLISLTNNPLLRKGIPERVHTESSGTSSRGITF